MGMPVTIDVRDDGIVLDAAFAVLRAADATFSTYRDDSTISRMNRGEFEVDEAGPDVRDVLERCEAARRATRGAFDARAPRPGWVDPSGLVKGWAVDRAAEVLERAGARDADMLIAVTRSDEVNMVAARSPTRCLA